MKLKQLFEIEKKPHKGLIALEWAILIYLVLTLAMVLFCSSKMPNSCEMIWGRISIVLIGVVTWGVYRMAPCRLTMALRVVAQMSMLSWWYPDTYEINRILPNLDHVFAGWEQSIFGCQPSLTFCKAMPWTFFSEAMCFGYASYYPLILVTVAYYFINRYQEFTKMAFVVGGAFFLYYAFYDLVPVVGPQFYYEAVGVDQIAQGNFPDLGHYFYNHQECLAIPGSESGFFHSMVQSAHNAGERPTAAFPSSHVGIATVLLMFVIRSRSKRFLCLYLPVFTLLCFSTVYIYAHYAIDAIAGLVTGVAIYFILSRIKVKA